MFENGKSLPKASRMQNGPFRDASSLVAVSFRGQICHNEASSP